MAPAVDVVATDFAPVPIKGLAGRALVEFPLYLGSGHGQFVLYHPGERAFDDRHEDRLIAEGVEHLFIREQDRSRYSRRIEADLATVLRDRSIQVTTRAAILTGVATEVARDLFAAIPDQKEVKRVQQVMACTATLVLRDPEVFRTIRGLLTSGSALHEHSLAVAMLSIGLASRVMSGDPEVLLTAGMAGLLHDVGRVGRDPADADQGHTTRGFKLLRGLGLPVPVCRAALSHHERLDGSGFPDGVGGDAIPLMARLVGVVDTFHRVYTESGGSRGGPQPVPDPAPGGGTGGGSGGVPGGGPGGVRRGVPGGAPRIGDANLGDARGDVYRALRVMAQVYRGCFDPKLVTALLQLFGR